jgi:NAD(P)-dependent dehydrogenase (short-subunit alcohol dehydrogenase family)
MSPRFHGKTALITGGGTGVGRATALRLASEGAAVALIGRRPDPLAAVAQEIGRIGGKALCLAADVSNAKQVAAAAEAAVSRFASLDLLVNAAGILKVGPIPGFAEADWDALFDVNVKGCYFTSRAAIPLMKGSGAIVNVSSVFAFAANKGAAAYAASKAAVVALTRTMALDHIEEGIRINGVAPGSMATPMLQSIAASASPANPAAVLDAIARMHPIRRMVKADEVASLIAFLLSDEASAIVGMTYTVDGGRLATLGVAP